MIPSAPQVTSSLSQRAVISSVTSSHKIPSLSAPKSLPFETAPGMPSSLLGIFQASQRVHTEEDKVTCKKRASEYDDHSDNKTRRQAPESQYFDKRPYLTEGQIVINGIYYPIETIGGGVFHKVFKFLGSPKLELDDRTILLNMCALKIINPHANPKKFTEQHKEDHKVVDYLKSLDIPIPTVHVCPKAFKDSINPKNGGFWIVDKMDTPVTCEEWSNPNIKFENLSSDNQKLLAFVKYYLTLSDSSQKEIINDFYPRNVMFGKGKWRVIDAGCPQKSWETNLASYVFHWSNKNPNIFAYLTSDLKNSIACVKQRWDDTTATLTL